MLQSPVTAKLGAKKMLFPDWDQLWDPGSVLIGDHLIFVGSHIVYLKDTLETKVGTPQSRMELRRVFIHGFHRFFRSNTKKIQGFFWRFQIASDPI